MLLVITKNANHKKTLKKSLFKISTNVYVGDVTVREKDFIVEELLKASADFQVLDFTSNFNNLKIGIKKENFMKNLVDFCFDI